MNKKQKKEIHQQLNEQLVGLSAAITDLESQKGSLTPDTSIGRISRMEAIEAASVNSTKMDNYRRHEQALHTALGRLEKDPDFGYCEECGNVIPAGRLALIPEATHCVRCAE